MQVKVLSIKNPYAYLIIQGGKDVENRTWTIDYRGRLYIHVSGDTLPFPTLNDFCFALPAVPFPTPRGSK